MVKPYSDVAVGGSVHRSFQPNVEHDELVWHRDRCDRHVHVVHGSGWWFQFDNEMPFRIAEGTTIDIPAMTFHRLLKENDCSRLDIEIQTGKYE